MRDQGHLKEVVETRRNDTQINQEQGNRHMDELTKKCILTRTLPNALDVEKAKKILLEHIYSISQAQDNIHLFSSSQLTDMVGHQHFEFAIPTTTEPGYSDSLEKELTSLRATIAAREALITLQANGVLIPFGPIFSPAGATSNSEEIREVKVPRDHQQCQGCCILGNKKAGGNKTEPFERMKG
jgi:hypothetical protein